MLGNQKCLISSASFSLAFARAKVGTLICFSIEENLFVDKRGLKTCLNGRFLSRFFLFFEALFILFHIR
jgi:hypothetical protein